MPFFIKVEEGKHEKTICSRFSPVKFIVNVKADWWKTLVTVLVVACLSLSASSQQNKIQETADTKSSTQSKAAHVVLITISGLGADLFQKSPESLPFLHAQAHKGATCYTVEGVYPTQSFPTLATLATGLLPADHGIMFSPEQPIGLPDALLTPNVLKQQPIWEALKQYNLTTALIGLPFSKQNSGWEMDSTQSQSSKDVAKNSPASSKPVPEKLMEQDQLHVQQALTQWQTARPNLLWVHFSSLEESQLLYGTSSKETKRVLEKLEICIKQLIEEIEKGRNTVGATFLIIGDHGMIAADQQFNPNVALAQKGWLSTNDAGEITEWKAMAKSDGGATAIYVKNQADEKAVEKLFNELYEKPDSPIWRIVTRQEISRLGADSKAAFFLDAAPGYQMGMPAKGRLVTRAKSIMASGYLPQRSEMRGVWLAFGKDIKVGVKLEYVRLIDAPPTITHLFRIKSKTFRGRVLSEIITPDASKVSDRSDK